jgi:excisionase family DNA binding protein
MSDARLLTARQLGERLSISPAAVLRWAARGEVPSFKLPGGAVRFDPAAIETWLRERTRKANGADEKREQPDAPSAARQDTPAILRPASNPDPKRGVPNEEG